MAADRQACSLKYPKFLAMIESALYMAFYSLVVCLVNSALQPKTIYIVHNLPNPDP